MHHRYLWLLRGKVRLQQLLWAFPLRRRGSGRKPEGGGELETWVTWVLLAA